jgi:hypothetical protein
MDKMNDRAIITIDFMIALVIVLAAVMIATQIMPALSFKHNDWRTSQYMAATRATDNLVQDTGESGWEEKWNTSVTKIGFVYFDRAKTTMVPKVLNLTKIKKLMGEGYLDSSTNTIWWEFPNSTIPQAWKQNASRSLGLEGYNFYLLLHPVGSNGFNSTINLTNRKLVPINDNTVSVVDRYVFIKNDNPSECDNKPYVCDQNNTTVHYRLNLWVW